MTRSRTCFQLRFVLLAVGVLSAAACGKDSTTAVPTDTTKLPTTSGFSISVDSLNNMQTAPAGTTITVVATVANPDKTPAKSQVVTWKVTGGGGTVSDSTTTTDATGTTRVKWTLGTTSGANLLTAGSAGAAFIVTATGQPGALAKLVKVTPDTQRVVSSGLVSLVVRPADQFGNPIPNIAVTWKSAGGGSVQPATATSGTSGNATVTFVTDAKATTYTITATAPGVPAVTFTIIGL
jgi:adhesin/invasin